MNADRDEARLEELLGQTVEHEAPPWLKRQVMHRILERKPSLSRRIAAWLTRPFVIRLSPAGALLTTALLTAAFFGGMLLERHRLPQAATARNYAVDARANYLVGRSLLAENKREEALQYLRRAAELEPGSAEYAHWQGVAFWTLGQAELERQSYARSMQKHPDYVPSLLYLGHSHLENGNYQAALDNYLQVLRHEPDTPEALYNSALAHQKMGNASGQQQALKRYLALYRNGKWAHHAVQHLHNLGDYSFRSYRIGIHQAIINVNDLLDNGSQGQHDEIARLARLAVTTSGEELHVVVYDSGGKQQARTAAVAIRRLLVEQTGGDLPVRTSWFDVAETIAGDHGGTAQVSPSVLVFSKPTHLHARRSAI